MPRSDTQCHGAKIEKEADQGRGVKRRDADRQFHSGKIDWKAHGAKRSGSGTRVGDRDTKTEPVLSLPPTLLAKGGVRFCGSEGLFYLQIGRTLVRPTGCRVQRGGGSSQFELAMSGSVLSLGVAAGGPLQTLKGPWYKKGPVDQGITSQDSYLLLATK